MTDILVRKAKFEFEPDLDDVFPGDEPDEELFRAAFSMTLPYLEPYLIKVYRQVVDDITDAELADDVRAFIGQEAQHHRNHRRANVAIKSALGADASRRITDIESDLADDYERFATQKSRRFNLVYAEGFEAMTCAWAMAGFARAAAGESPGRMGPWRQLWAWHAAEEIEHRTVAYRVYEHFVGSYPYRVAGSIRAQTHFLRYTTRLEKALAAALDRPYRPRVPMAIRRNLRSYAATFAPGYDPADLEPDPLVDVVLASTPQG